VHQSLDGIVAMEREPLERLWRKCRGETNTARWRCSALWLRNRLAYVSVVASYVLLVAGAGAILLGNSEAFSGWTLVLVVLIIWVITRFLASLFNLAGFLERRRDEERLARELLNTRLDTLRAIRRRFRQLGAKPVS
jgi:hypothetical protein